MVYLDRLDEVNQSNNAGGGNSSSNSDLFKSMNTNEVKGKTSIVDIKIVQPEDSNSKILSYDFVPLIPNNSSITQTNISLYGVKENLAGLRLIKAGLPLQTESYSIDSSYSNFELRVEVEYEKIDSGEYISLKGTNRLTLGSNPINYDITSMKPTIESNEDLVNYLMTEINALKSRIDVLEQRGNS